MDIETEKHILSEQGAENNSCNCAKELVKLVKDISLISNRCYAVFDCHRNEYLFVSGDNSVFFNIKRNEGDGCQLFFNSSEEEDTLLVYQIQKRALRFLLRQEVRERTKFVFSIVVRMACCERETDAIFRVKPQVLDREGKIWLSISSIEETSNYQPPKVIHIETGEEYFFKLRKEETLKSTIIPLTKKEEELLKEMAKGRSSGEICEELRIKEPTFKRHRAEIYRKLGVNSKIRAINKAIVNGIVEV